MDRYFYSVEMDGDRKVVHMSGNVYFNDADESGRDYRIAEWTGLYIAVDKLKELIDNDNFWEYINEQVAYLGDLTEDEAKDMCKVFFDGSSGEMFDIRFINEDTPCGDYWFE
jgi:hypothetical protein